MLYEVITQKKLKLSRLPQRIECFDNSNISGAEAVASMVVFEKGQPEKSAYRHFKIKTVDKNDDYAYMAEVLTRRLKNWNSQKYSEPLVITSYSIHYTKLYDFCEKCFESQKFSAFALKINFVFIFANYNTHYKTFLLFRFS